MLVSLNKDGKRNNALDKRLNELAKEMRSAQTASDEEEEDWGTADLEPKQHKADLKPRICPICDLPLSECECKKPPKPEGRPRRNPNPDRPGRLTDEQRSAKPPTYVWCDANHPDYSEVETRLASYTYENHVLKLNAEHGVIQDAWNLAKSRGADRRYEIPVTDVIKDEITFRVVAQVLLACSFLLDRDQWSRQQVREAYSDEALTSGCANPVQIVDAVNLRLRQYQEGK